jgi:peroxiredoxin Q/BCP
VGTAYDAVRGPDEQYPDFPRRISYLIDPGGVIARSYTVTDTAGHAGEVLADLAELQGS